MHISIEGMDGAGKTTIAKMLAEKLEFRYVAKPLHLLTDTENSFDNYRKILDWIRDVEDDHFRALFLGMSNYYLSILTKDENIVTDRHILSNMYLFYREDNEEYFDYLVKICGKPDLTVILYAPAEERRQRIAARSPHDKDLKRNVFDDAAYDRMKELAKKYQMPFLFIDTTAAGIETIVDRIMDKIGELAEDV